jgi:hypothetical protein
MCATGNQAKSPSRFGEATLLSLEARSMIKLKATKEKMYELAGAYLGPEGPGMDDAK